MKIKEYSRYKLFKPEENEDYPPDSVFSFFITGIYNIRNEETYKEGTWEQNGNKLTICMSGKASSYLIKSIDKEYLILHNDKTNEDIWLIQLNWDQTKRIIFKQLYEER